MVERLNNTIETQVSEGNTLVSQVTENKQVIQTTIQNVPQVQTVLQNGINVSSQINAPFVEVTSVNGMTGDVITEAEILDFEANKYYRKSTLVNHEGKLYWAKENFTSGSIFDSDDWNAVEAGDINWSDITGKPTFATVATSGSFDDLSNKPNFATVATSGSYTDLINTPSPYSLPVASNSVLGGIKVGDNLSIDNNGVLSATASGQGGKVYYFTDTLNTSVGGSFPSTFRIFKDENYIEEAEFGDINTDLDKGVALTVRVEQRYQSGSYLWGTVESGYAFGGQDVFCIKLMGNTMAYPTDFRIMNSMNITSTTYYYQGYDITPVSSIPTASTSTKGVVKIGSGLNITSAGLLSTKLQFVDGPSAEDIDWSLVINKIYPVGSIYISTTLDTVAKVQAAFGGTWIAWGSGRVPVGVDTSQTEFNSAEKTGGNKTHTHGLTNGYAKLILKGNGQVRYQERSVAAWTDNYYVPSSGSGGGGSDSQGYATNLDGSTNAGSSLQPYITCYMYKRTA